MVSWLLVVHVLCNPWFCHDEWTFMETYTYHYETMCECVNDLTSSKMQDYEDIGNIMLCVPNKVYRNES